MQTVLARKEKSPARFRAPAAARPHAAQPVAVRNILRQPRLQPRLRIGAVNDRFEQEADRVADQVMRMPMTMPVAGSEPGISGLSPSGRSIQRMCPGCEDEIGVQRMTAGGGAELDEEELVQPKEMPGAAPALSTSSEGAIRALSGGGGPLPASERAFFEPRFGQDFGGVRVHTGPAAHNAASAINARAFTLGSDIAFGRGKYAPGSSAGRRLLAHELTHVVQQLPGIARQQLPPRRPRVPTLARTGNWELRVLLATGERNQRSRARMYLELINEALLPDTQRYSELTLPVLPFRSDVNARQGQVLFDATLPGEPGRRGVRAVTCSRDATRTQQCRSSARTGNIFIVMGAAALSPDAGPEFTQRALNHEYVHVLQNLHGQLTRRPACRGAWRGQPLGGNPNREVLAVSTTFARFFSRWADAASPESTDYPHHLLEDLMLLQAYFPCADRQLQAQALGPISTLVRGHTARRQHLRRLVQEVRDRALPNVNLPRSDNAMEQLADLIGSPLTPDLRLPTPSRPRRPLLNPSSLLERSRERMRQRILESVRSIP